MKLSENIVRSYLAAQIVGCALMLYGCGDNVKALNIAKSSPRTTKYVASTLVATMADKNMPPPSDSKDRGSPTDDGTNIDVDGGSSTVNTSDRDGDDGRNTNPWGGVGDNSGGVDYGSSGENPWGGVSDNSGGVAF